LSHEMSDLEATVKDLNSQKGHLLAEIALAKSDSWLASFRVLAEANARQVLGQSDRRKTIAIAVSCMIDALQNDKRMALMLELGSSSQDEAIRLYGESLSKIVERSFDLEAKRFASSVIEEMVRRS